MKLPSADDPELDALLDRLATGDEDAARQIHERYTPGLITMARRRLGMRMQGRCDPESVVQSAMRSFFRRCQVGDFVIGTWDDIVGLLAVITVRKCSNRRRFHHRECRDVNREVAIDRYGEPESGEHLPADPGLAPPEMLAFEETIAEVFEGLDTDDRLIIELLLAGHTIEETRRQIGCSERTVRRVRDRVRAKLRAEATDS